MSRKAAITGTVAGLMLLAGIGITVLQGPSGVVMWDGIVGSQIYKPDIGVSPTRWAGSIHTKQWRVSTYENGGLSVFPWAWVTPTWDPDVSASVIIWYDSGHYRILVWDEDGGEWLTTDPSQSL